MNSRVSALLSAAVIVSLTGCTNAPAPAAATNTARASAATVTPATSGPETTLQKGMTAAMVRSIMGEPGEIRPMNSPEGKAETWVYHRMTRGTTKQFPIGATTTDITTIGADGKAHVHQVTGETIVRMETQIIDETINLLMFDDQLIEQNKSVRRRMEYQ